jgi:hypothetical protein
MDSNVFARYAHGMRTLRTLLLLVLTTATLSPLAPVHAADPPVLAVLEYPGGWFTKRAKIYAQANATTSPFAGKPQPVWTLRAGDTLKTPTPPAEGLIQLYQASGNDLQVLCVIIVKYVRAGDGWRPAFLVNPQPAVMVEGNKVVPIATEDTVRGRIRVLHTSTPSADGFYSAFSFASISGLTQIDAWAVQQ